MDSGWGFLEDIWTLSLRILQAGASQPPVPVDNLWPVIWTA